MSRVMCAIHDHDLATFVEMLQKESWLLGERCIGFQVGLIERATLRERGEFIEKLLELEPALLRARPPEPSQAIEFALTYTHPHLLPLLTRIWPLDNYQAMQFLIDRGIDMTIRDHRWNATAEGWARVGAGNQKMGDWLAEAQRQGQQLTIPVPMPADSSVTRCLR